MKTVRDFFYFLWYTTCNSFSLFSAGMSRYSKYRNKNLKTLSRCLLFFGFLFFAFNTAISAPDNQGSAVSFSLPQSAYAEDNKKDDSGGFAGWVGDGVSWAFSWFLVGTLQVWGFLIGVGEWVLNWALDVDSVNAVLNSTAISEAWKVVRDFLNILFIVFLLFSAFATIFQVKKYHLKSVMLMVVIMALLVNFSYPIARFVIDTGNVPMYYMLQKAFASSGSAAAAEISNQSNVVCQLVPNYGDCKATASELVALGVAQLLAANIFTFMFAITLVIIAILFVIRLAVLGFLIVLSPAGFVLAAFPSMQQYADDWWKQLIKQTFFGPIMVFMLILSVKFMATLNAEALNAVHGGGTSTSTGFPQTIAKFAIPMVILWSGLIIAQKMGAAGADIVVGGGRKFMLGALKKLSGWNAAKRFGAAYSARRKEAEKRSAATRLGNWTGSRQDRIAQVVRIPGKKSKLRNKARQDYQKDLLTEVEKRSKDMNMADMDPNVLKQLADSSNPARRIERAAATLELAKQGLATEEQLNALRSPTAFGKDGYVPQKVASTMEGYDPVAAFNPLKNPDNRRRMREYMEGNKFKFGNINDHSVGDKEFLETILTSDKFDESDIEKIRTNQNEGKIMDGLRDLSEMNDFKKVTGISPSELKRNIKIQKARFSQTGTINTGNHVDDAAFMAEIAPTLSSNTLKRLNKDWVTDSKNKSAVEALLRNIRPGRYPQILIDMNDQGAAHELNGILKNNGSLNKDAFDAMNADKRAQFI